MADGGLLESLASGLSPEMVMFLYIIGLILGLILVFIGKLLWRPLMSIIGSFIGGIIGFVIGFILGGNIGGLIGASIGAILGGIIFIGIAEFSVAALASLVGLGLVYFLTSSLLIGLIAGALIFILVSIFIDQIIGIMMAVLGGLIAGVCIDGLGIEIEIAAIIALALMIAGSVIQTLFLRIKPKVEKQPKQASTCMRCGTPIMHDQYSNRWYCPNCDAMAPPPPTNTQ